MLQAALAHLALPTPLEGHTLTAAPGEDAPPIVGDEGAAPALPLPAVDGYAKFPVGTRVRDILSGREGNVVEKPEGDFGIIVFIDFDGRVEPLRSDQLQAVEVAPLVPAPVPEGGAPAPAPEGGELPAPAGEERIPAEASAAPGTGHALKANAEGKPYRRAFKMLKRDEMAEPVVQEKALSAARQDFMVSGAQDERNITYTSILQQAKASGNATHASILSYIGYVPGNWDQVLAALAEDGIKLESQKNFPDPQRLHASGLSKVELRYILAMAGMPTVKIDAALKVFADTPAPAEKPQDPPRAGYAWTWDPVAAQYKETKVG